MMIPMWGLYCGLTVLGALGIHFFAKLSGQAGDPLLAMFFAHIVATVSIGVVYFLGKNTESNISSINIKIFIWMLLMGFCIALANCAVLYMYKHHAPISIAVPVTRTAVALLSVLLGVLFFSEVLSPIKLGGFVLSLVSIYMMTRS